MQLMTMEKLRAGTEPRSRRSDRTTDPEADSPDRRRRAGPPLITRASAEPRRATSAERHLHRAGR